jgi:diphthamide biosynthesis protein 2
MTTLPSAPPVLATPDSHIFEDPTPVTNVQNAPRLSPTQLFDVYEVARTAREIHAGGWRRVALQFPDSMLRDASMVFDILAEELSRISVGEADTAPRQEDLEQSFNDLKTTDTQPHVTNRLRHKLHILADTSYGACCVDEIAAEHVDAEVVVHYGRSCLSPTARLPVIYVFTSRPLELDPVIAVFENTYPEKHEKVILMADIIYHSHVEAVSGRLRERGYTNVLAPGVIHDPSSIIPNRKVDTGEDTKEDSIFHISDPPPALLLTLSSRVKELNIYPTTTSATPKALQSNTAMALRRRYALLTSLSTCSIFGILINTLSVKNYLQTVSNIKDMIEMAGKKSYTFVVGKVNAAKIANFSEIGGWVVIGCWESSLIESAEFYRPIITPFELSLCLQGDNERVWSGEWRGDFNSLSTQASNPGDEELDGQDVEDERGDGGDLDSEEESEPPEFDLRTGRYVSHSRPLRNMRPAQRATERVEGGNSTTSSALMKRANGDLAVINGTVSPGAEYLKSQRTWAGLGSDFHENEASAAVEEGRTGVARGYTVGDDIDRR